MNVSLSPLLRVAVQVIEPWSDLRATLSRTLGDQYRLGAMAGRGGMGVVYRATDLTLEREVAVKVIHPEFASNKSLSSRFLTEARLIARLRHPNIVTVYSAGEAAGTLYYVMDYVEGETLRARLGREGALPLGDAIRISAEIAAALDEAAGAGVVHRDIKPENILLDAATGRSLLVDFGIAHAVGGMDGDDDGARGPTGPGIAIGTPAYMSPEQAAGEPVDARSDLYGLGVVLYEMLAGRPPFDGPRRVVISKQIVDPPPSLRGLRPDIPAEIANVVDKALSKDPELRWQSGRAFREAMQGRGARASLRPRLRQLVLGLGAAATIVATTAVSLRTSGTPAEGNPRHSLLVLPFTNIRNDSNAAWLRDGSASMLGLALSQWQELTVVDQERLHDLLDHRRVGSGEAIGFSLARRLAREAGVGTMVLGEYTTQGDSIHLVARAYDVRSGNRLDLAQAEGSVTDDVRPLFDELAAKLLDLSGAPRGEEWTSLSTVTTGSLEAYRYYLTGVEHLTHWRLPEAERDLLLAVALDSTFSLAYFKLALERGWRAGADDSLGRAYITAAARSGSRLPPREQQRIEAYRSMTAHDFDRSRTLYAELVASDSTDAGAWYGLGDAWFHSPEPGLRASAMTHSLRAFRRALALDPRYHLAYDHVSSLLTQAAVTGPSYALLDGDAFVRTRNVAGRLVLNDAALQRAQARARRASETAARDWVAAQPSLPRAHRALLEAQLVAANHAAALTTVGSLRDLADDHTRPLVAFLEARVRFASGRTVQAAEVLRSALATFDPECFEPDDLTPEIVNDVLFGANVFAFAGELENASRVISAADRLRGSLVPEGVVSDAFGDGRVWRDGRLAQIYSAAGAPMYELRSLWQRVARTARDAAPEERPYLAWAAASAAQGLLLGPSGDQLPIEELRSLTGASVGREFEALIALSRGDSVGARRSLADRSSRDTPKGDTSAGLALNPRAGFAMGDLRPLAAEANFLLGNYKTTLELLAEFDEDHLSSRSFDSRWGLLPRLSLLRGLAYEQLGQLREANNEFTRVLTLWQGADDTLQPVVLQAQAALARLKGARG